MANQLDFQQLIQSYRLGFITSYELIYQYISIWIFSGV